MTQATMKHIEKLCKFWNEDINNFIIGKLSSITFRNFIPSSFQLDYLDKSLDFRHCTPLTDEQIKCLGLEILK